jgi:ADP-heptose:LPS heptosyltransferase
LGSDFLVRKLLLKNGFSVGDIVMLTAAVRDLHRCYPGQFLTDVRTSCPELWEHNPYLTPMAEEDPDVEVIDCLYPLIDRCNTAPYHCLHGFMEFLNHHLHLQIKPTAFRGDIHLTDQEKSWYSQVREMAGRDIPFWIVAAGGKYDISIKWWDSRRYQEVIDYFKGRISFVQVGAPGHFHPALKGVIDLRGRTSLRELVRLVYHAQGVVCGVTGLMHLAAAVEYRNHPAGNRPCVVIAGGREPVHWEAYPGHQFIATNGALVCCQPGGCWKASVIPPGEGEGPDHTACLCEDVVRGLPRCMDMIGADEVVRRIELYYRGGLLRYLSPAQRAAAKVGVRASVPSGYDEAPLTLPGARMACERFVRQLPAYPGGYHGRGIVICAGGAGYFTGAWVGINMLRYLGCQLPIQVWYLGESEMDAVMRSLLASLQVECVDALQVRRRKPVRRLGGWELKPYALLYSRFREVLLLDADNMPVRNPEYLFETAPYRKTGAIFWPDYGRFERTKAIWESCGLSQPEGPEFESGQIVVDKQRCWRALRLALWFNEHSDFYYRYLHGDKETFHLAFHKLRQDYGFVPTPIQGLVGTMCQHDFHGRRIFQHRNTDKWAFHLRNRVVKGFRFEAECRQFVVQLHERWDGRLGG